MNHVKQQDDSPIYNVMVYAFALILFLEWIYPVKDVAEPLNLNVFIIYTVLCFVISWMRLHWLLSFGVKLVGLVLIVNHLFIDATLLSKAWISELGTILTFNISKMWSTQWLELTAMFRTLLFLILIWMMSYLLYYWFVTAKRMMLFVILTFVYLGLLDTFTIYDGSSAVIRVFITAFMALGLSNFIKEMSREALSSSKKWAAWVVPVLIVIGISSAIGYTAPKFSPQWPDPVSFIENHAEDAGIGDAGKTVQKVGYGEDDSRLGGSFVQDDRTVFQGTAEEAGYWRVESKSVYTGKGWENAQDPEYKQARSGSVDLDDLGSRVKTERSVIMMDFSEGETIGKLPYHYGVREFGPVSSEQTLGFDFLYDRMTGGVKVDEDSIGGSNLPYEATIDQPMFNIDALKEVKTDDFKYHDQYTQVPDSLPERVSSLAEELTANIDNRYDKAKTIEQYFGGSGFKYQIEGVPVPDADQDYVDQFLFESQEGYCDNYSSTMAVMLRTLNIPTRWVKGFTAGEVDGKLTINSEEFTGDSIGRTTLNTYDVQSSNAHSWVEVYFPEHGWVPFEPTQGFENLTDFTTNEMLEGSNEEDPDESDRNDETETEQNTQDPQASEQVEENDASVVNRGDDDTWNGWLLIVVSAAILLIVFIIFLTRWRWRTAYLGYMLRHYPTNRVFQRAYHFLLKLLAHKGLPKREEQTLRSYAKKIDWRFETTLMGVLTARYEQMLYSRHPRPSDHDLMKDWQSLMKRILP